MTGQQDLLLLIAEDEVVHGRDREAVIEAVRVAAQRCGREISRNDIAPHIPDWVYHRVVGATYSWLIRKGAMTRVGWVYSDDRKGRNGGRHTALYRVNLTVLASLSERTNVA